MTIVEGGYKSNVVPSTARAEIDGRFLPGRLDDFLAEFTSVVGPDVTVTEDHLPAVETTFDGALVEAMAAAIDAEDPGRGCCRI